MIKNFDTEKLTPEQNAVIESILKMQNAEIQPEQKFCVWKPVIGDEYYFNNFSGNICKCTWADMLVDNNAWDIGNCYQTEEEAKFARERLKVIAELRRFAEEHNDPIDWNKEMQKYEISCYHNSGEADIHISFTYYGHASNICFSSKEIAQAAINEIGKDRILKYYFEVKEKTE